MQSLDEKETTWPALSADLRRYGTETLEPHGIALDFESSLDAAHGRPKSFVWLNIFRIYKESLTNIIKHSGAKNVRVFLEVNAEQLTLSISDDGKGLRPPAGAGRGISNMRHRAKEMGGGLNISSDGGVNLRLELPVKYPIQGIEGAE